MKKLSKFRKVLAVAGACWFGALVGGAVLSLSVGAIPAAVSLATSAAIFWTVVM